MHNPLRELGYRSVGCSPCTRPVAAGEDERSGRWQGRTKVECGLHLCQLPPVPEPHRSPHARGRRGPGCRATDPRAAGQPGASHRREPLGDRGDPRLDGSRPGHLAAAGLRRHRCPRCLAHPRIPATRHRRVGRRRRPE
jgi:hypothetical protein